MLPIFDIGRSACQKLGKQVLDLIYIFRKEAILTAQYPVLRISADLRFYLIYTVAAPHTLNKYTTANTLAVLYYDKVDLVHSGP